MLAAEFKMDVRDNLKTVRRHFLYFPGRKKEGRHTLIMEELRKLKIPREQMEEKLRKERLERNRRDMLDQEATYVNECIQKAIEKGQQSVTINFLSLENREILEANQFVVRSVETGSMLLCHPPRMECVWVVSWSLK